MKVDIKLLKKLRDTTLAGFGLCQKALQINNNDFDKALNWLRVQGAHKALTKVTRDAKDGCCGVFTTKEKAILLQLSSETDFVARTTHFQKFFQQLGHFFLKQNAQNLAAAEKLIFSNDQSVKAAVLQLSSQFGEKVAIVQYLSVTKKPEESFAFYNHNDQKSCALLILSGRVSEQLSEELAMHVVAMKPKFISLQDIPDAFILQEKSVIAKQIKQNKGQFASKTPALLEKIIVGKLNKSLQEFCLLEQNFVIDPTQKIRNILKQNNVKICSVNSISIVT